VRHSHSPDQFRRLPPMSWSAPATNGRCWRPSL